MQPRELPAKWREEAAEARAVEEDAAANGSLITAAGANNATLAKEQCASELEAALAEEGDDPNGWEARCAEAYQVIGSLAIHADVFDHPDVIRALDRASGGDIDGELLPWPREDLGIKLAETGDGWLSLADAPLGVPLELWGREPTLQRGLPYEGGGWSLRLTLDTTWSNDPRPMFARLGFSHARLVTPPPGESDAQD